MAIAACVFELAKPTVQADGSVLLQVTPAGSFLPNDGRDMDSPPWHITAASASSVIDRFRARANPSVIDYEHQTLNKEKNGQPAPAAGWMRDLRWVEGEGLFAVADLTPRARGLIDAKEYLYFSPVFEYSRSTGAVLDVHMGALTNNPAIHGMAPLSLLAAATAAFVSRPQPSQEKTLNPLLKALLAALGLPETTTEDQAVVALTAIGSLTDVTTARAQAAAARTALKLGDDASADSVIAACSSLRSTGVPDPAKYVPIGTVEELRTNLAALSARQLQGDIDQQVGDALDDGRLLPAMETWARDLGKSNLAALSSYLKAAAPIAALSGTQTRGQPPAKGENGLTADETAVAAATGVTPEAFAKAKT
ncbi:phage protease [Variovorax sp. UMC13]|uniref:phage protease n=1 Tax=Variovorax sp. UMC13 TaxID=1862326 RepID=UPI00287B8100|nr:phage protease [Variovorax sp. UMC13]